MGSTERPVRNPLRHARKPLPDTGTWRPTQTAGPSDQSALQIAPQEPRTSQFPQVAQPPNRFPFHRHRLVRGVRAANHSSGSVPRRERHGAPPAPEPAPRASPGAAVNTRARLGGTAPRPAFRFPGWLAPWLEGSPAAAADRSRTACKRVTHASSAHHHIRDLAHTPAAAAADRQGYFLRASSPSPVLRVVSNRRSPVGVRAAISINSPIVA